MKKLTLTETQEQAIHTMREPAYHADGTKIHDNTGRALAKKGLSQWDGYQNAWELTVKGSEYAQGFIVD